MNSKKNVEKLSDAEFDSFVLVRRSCPATHSPKGSVDSFGPDDDHVDD